MLGFDLKDGPLQKYDKEIDKTKEKSNGLATAAKGVGNAYKWAAAAVAVGVGWISKNIIEATLEMEGYRSQIQAFTGDADSAAETLAELRDKTVDPLFGTGNLVNAYKQLRTVGMGAEETSQMIDVLGDVANGSADNFNMLSNTLQRVAATGKFSSMQMNQLATAGFGAADMAQALGVSEAQLRKSLDEGKIGFEELTKALKNSTAEGGRFYMNAANQALTLNGAIKILQDTIGSMGDAIGTKVLPALANLIGYVTDLIKLGRDNFVDFGAKAFDFLIHIIAQVIIFFEVLQMRVKKLGLSFEPLKAIFKDVFGALGKIIKAAAPVLIALVAAIMSTFEPIRSFVAPVLEGLVPIFEDVFGFMAKLLGNLVPIIQSLTPAFAFLGGQVKIIFGAIRIILQNVMNAIIAAFKPIKAFVEPIILALKPIVEQVIGRIIGLFNKVGTSTSGLGNFISSLTPLFSTLGKIAGFVLNILATGALTVIDAIMPFAKIILVVIAAIKIWTAVQWLLNVALNANPIGLIILAIVALIGIIVLLVKNIDKVGAFFVKVGNTIAGFFTRLWNSIKNAFARIVAFVKKNLVNIINIIITILFPLAGIVMALVRLIIKHWDTIKAAFIKVAQVVVNGIKTAWEGLVNIVKAIMDRIKAVILAIVEGIKIAWQGFASFMSVLWEGIKTAAATIWEGIKAVFFIVIDAIKAAWQGFSNFITGLWEGIKAISSSVWNGITAVVGAVIETIKGLWQGFVDFFSGLFTWIGDVASGVWDRIKESFTAVFDGIRQKFLGFIEVIQAGWEKVKGFFGGIGEGVVNFFTGGNKDSGGNSSTAKTSGTSSSGTGSLTQTAAATAAARNTYNNAGNTQTINSSANINLTVPPGTSSQQAEFLSREVDRAVQESLSSAIGGSRGAIPSPEARRN
jgi:tape measure domain-containing protein